MVEHAKIPIAFTVGCILDISTLTDGSFASAERAIQPYAKDYDAVEPPAQWAVRFDLTKWGLIAAYHSNNRVGGAVIAFDTPEVDLLEGRNDLALLWDIRVRPEVRYQGIGSVLFRAAEQWALAQNINLPACRFYQRQGCVLRAVNHAAYREFPEEIQLLWYKELRPSGHARTGTRTEG